MESSVYCIRCVQTNQCYVGTALDWSRRARQHKSSLNKGIHKNWKLQEAWNRYGADSFEFELLEICDAEIVLEREHWWAAELTSQSGGFNLHSLGSNGHQSHGKSYTRTFKSWDSMKQRCLNTRSSDYPRYGGRGVTICPQWLTFENFLADMGERPLGASLDRYPNKHGNYEPGNCRWATPSEQQRNIRNNQYLTLNGETKLLIDWADEKQIPIDLLRQRVLRGLEGNDLFAPSYFRFEGIILADGSKPKRQKIESDHATKYTAHGKTLTLTQWSKELGIGRGALAQRIQKYKMDPEIALTATYLKKGREGPRKGHRMLTAFGKTQSLTAWARETGLSVSTLKNRIDRATMLPEIALRAPRYAQQSLMRKA